MATYAAMRATFISLLNRTDCADADAALVKGWFDNSIQRIQREVRAPHMEEVLTVDTAAEVSSVTVPNDWLDTKAFVWDDGADGGEIDEVDIGTFYRRKNSLSGGTPVIFSREAQSLLVAAPIPSGVTAKLIYWKEETPLVNGADVTVLSSIAPDLIIYGALTYAADYFTDDRKDGWEAKWQFFREQIQAQATGGEMGSGMAVQPFAEYDDGV